MQISEVMARFKKLHKRASFTLERGRGQTYSHSRPVLYGHSTYSRGSVLAGRPLRQWLETWETWEEAREALKGQRYDDYGPEGGSTHIDVDVLTQDLPDDEG